MSAYIGAQREAQLGGDGPSRTERAVCKRLEAAEQAFDRAMTGVGGQGFTRGVAETINQVAEIDTLRKSATVAKRPAALKAQRAA